MIAENAAYAGQLQIWPSCGPGGRSGRGDRRWSSPRPATAAQPGSATSGGWPNCSDARQVVVDDSRHLMMLDRPDVIADAIHSL